MYYLTMIIPAFNCEDCIDDSINSVINQTIGFENIELIIVDDCSTDNTREIIKDYEKRYPNIKGIFLRKNNGVAGIPRNIGIKNASSKYLMFMDADDEYEKNACEIFYNKFVETNADFIFSNWLQVADNNITKSTHNYLRETKEYPFNNGENVKEWFKYFHRGGMSASIFNKEFILNNNIKCHKELGEDGYFILNALLDAKKIVFINYCSYYNKLRDNSENQSVTNIRTEKMFNSRLKSVYLFNELLDKYGVDDKNCILNSEVMILSLLAYTIDPSIKNKKRKEFFIKINNLEKEFDIKKFDDLIPNILNFFIVNEFYLIAILISRILGYIFNKPNLLRTLRNIVYTMSNSK